ncbi:AraC family transcriptional regulator [Mesorhizobium sp. CU2]|nr:MULTISPECIES: AraC family transcriptional regulator [unclassified Mesorhizobium]TPN77738.1 AraC family transcriptional regulator [Mesorhizobium sp. CU3]TPO18423.1 AraC family transcriptional regulator [Mesorhizobium sp. CU2]
MTDRHFALYRSPPAAMAGLAVKGIGRHRVSRAIVGRKLPDFAVVLVEDGQGWLETKAAGRQAVVAPSLFWLFPGRTHSYGPDDAGWSERWALFTGAMTRDFTRMRLIAEQAPVVAVSDLGGMQHLFDRLHAELSLDTALAHAEAAATLHGLVARAARQAAGASAGETGPDFQLVIEALRARAIEPLDLEAFAAQFAMSPATLRRKFAQHTGLSPKAFQLRIRLDLAKQLLVAGDSPVESVAAAVGIQDAFYFSRLFRDRESCSPSEFRRRHKRG